MIKMQILAIKCLKHNFLLFVYLIKWNESAIHSSGYKREVEVFPHSGDKILRLLTSFQSNIAHLDLANDFGQLFVNFVQELPDLQDVCKSSIVENRLHRLEVPAALDLATIGEIVFHS